jgi:hypothetical protein
LAAKEGGGFDDGCSAGMRLRETRKKCRARIGGGGEDDEKE